MIDFGSSCFIDDHLSSYVQSRSYRAPEADAIDRCWQDSESQRESGRSHDPLRVTPSGVKRAGRKKEGREGSGRDPSKVMLGLPYDQKIDLWSLGCILAELWTGQARTGTASSDELHVVLNLFGRLCPVPKRFCAVPVGLVLLFVLLCVSRCTEVQSLLARILGIVGDFPLGA